MYVGEIMISGMNTHKWLSVRCASKTKRLRRKIKELQDFISRFSANASKSKQATSRKKLLDSIKVEDIPVSSRRFPYVDFKPDRKVGNEVLTVTGISKTIGDRKVLDNVSFTILPRQKVAFVGSDPLAKQHYSKFSWKKSSRTKAHSSGV